MTLDYRMIVLTRHGVGWEPVKVPSQPPIDGLPLWAQLVISFVIGLATLLVAAKGYLVKEHKQQGLVPEGSQSAAILGASIADMGAIRNLSDCVVRLDASVQALTRCIDESTHYERNNVEISREMCARLRELAEELQRQGNDLRAWDKRDEKRR
jgi:hypothetical protein